MSAQQSSHLTFWENPKHTDEADIAKQIALFPTFEESAPAILASEYPSGTFLSDMRRP